MKKINCKLLSVLMILSSFCIVLMGCGTETVKGDKTAAAFYNMFIKQDSSDMKDIGISLDEENDAMDTYKTELKKATKLNFTKSGVSISDENLDKIINAQLEAMKKLDAEFTIVSEDEDSCEVKVSTNYVELTQLDQKAANDALTSVKAMKITNSSEAQKKFIEVYVENLVNECKSVQPSSEKNEKTFTFKKEKFDCDGKVKDVYSPEDYKAFGEDIGLMTTSKQ